MAEERNLGLARAPESQTDDDANTTKAELQRRMEEARESISQTVNEIKETVSNQYNQVRQTLDWREQYRRHPVEFSAGALGIGFLLGYTVGGVLVGGRGDEAADYEADTYLGEEDEEASISASRMAASPRSYAAQPVLGAASSAQSAYESASPMNYGASGASEDVGPQSHYTTGASSAAQPASRPSYSSGYESATAFGDSSTAAADGGEEEESKKPGLLQRVKESGVIDKFKETKAYDRLQEEIASLGDRFVEELSNTAKTVVLPALLGKLKDMIGLDLGTQRQASPRGPQQAGGYGGGGTTSASAQGAGATMGTPGATSGATGGTTGGGATGGGTTGGGAPFTTT